VGVRFLTEDDRASPDQFWNKNDRDLVYTGLNIKFVKAFLAHAKMKANGKMCSNSNISKVQGCNTMGFRSRQASPPFYFLQRDQLVPQVIQEGNEESRKRRHVR